MYSNTPFSNSSNATEINTIPLREAETSTQRWLWGCSVLITFIGLVGIALHAKFQNEWLLFAPLAIGYGLLPALDLLLGKSTKNFSEAAIEQMEQDKFYQYLTYAIVPLQLLIFLSIAWYCATQINSLTGLIALGLTSGTVGGFAINAAHELGHKTTKTERLLAKVALAIPAYGHFCVEHNSGHHRDVATPEDHASSKMGESIYRFMLREIPGGLMRGLESETKRLKRQNKPFLSLSNQILQSYVMSFVLHGLLLVVFGWKMLLFVAIHIAWSWWQLTSANYIEHYGLLRDKNDNGRYESCKPHHSWNACSTLSNLVLFQLERHSDHHANPARRYQILRNFNDVPELPTGYFGMYLVAYIPWLWFKIMDKKLLAVPHINGDMQKVNAL